MYRELIQQSMQELGLETFGDRDIAVIEAWMRLEHPTLDGLSGPQFKREVGIAAATSAVASEQENNALVESFGLDKTYGLSQSRAPVAVLDTIPTKVICAWCGGSGALTTGETCTECDGTGEVEVQP